VLTFLLVKCSPFSKKNNLRPKHEKMFLLFDIEEQNPENIKRAKKTNISLNRPVKDITKTLLFTASAQYSFPFFSK
jgi:hypothetical protein